MNRKIVIWSIAGIALLGAAAFFILGRPSQAAESAALQTNETVTAFIGDLAANATASGQIVPQREANLTVSSPEVVTNVYVRVGDTVAAGAPLLQLDTTTLSLNLANAQTSLAIAEARLAALIAEPNGVDVAAAEAAVRSALANLDELRAGPAAATIAVSTANVNLSQASLASSAASLNQVQDSVTESQIIAAEAALLSAQIRQEAAQETNADNPTAETHAALQSADQALAQAQADLDRLRAGPDAGELGAAQSSVAAAAARLDSSEANLNIAVSGATDVQIAAAQAQLAQAQASLANLLSPTSPEDLQVAAAEVEQAALSLADAEEALAATAVEAPFAGLVTAVHVSEGELASGIVLTLADRNSLEVVLSVDEVDIAAYTSGQPATITLESWPDQEIAGEITSIAPSANASSASAIVTYDVNLSLDSTDLPILIGMTANASLVTTERTDVLLVPNQAITADRDAGQYFVTRVNSDGSEAVVEVTIGLRDSAHTEIVSGLSAGDTLVIKEIPLAEEEGFNGPFGG